MENKLQIRIFVQVCNTDNRDVILHHEHTTGEDIRKSVGAAPHTEVFLVREEKWVPIGNEERIRVKNGEQFAVIPHGALHYLVNGEPQWTHAKEMTPERIMEEAGVDPAHNYLVELKGHAQESFKDTPTKPIHMHNDMRFITQFMGPKPVSGI